MTVTDPLDDLVQLRHLLPSADFVRPLSPSAGLVPRTVESPVALPAVPVALDLPDPEGEPTPLAQRVGRIMRRAADSLLRAEDWPWAAGVVLALPEVARAFRALETVESLRQRHAERVTVTDLGEVRLCASCAVRYPCPTAEALG